MPGKLVDMQIAYTDDSTKLAHDIYNAFPDVLKKKLKFYDDLLRRARSDRDSYLQITKEPPTAVRDRKEDVLRYLDEVHGVGFDDFCLTDQKLFGDKEIRPQHENVRGRDVFFIGSLRGYENDYEPNVGYMKWFLSLDALKRASARERVLVAPYMGYGRQDRKDKPRVPISFRLMADLLTTAGMTKLLTMDLHASQEQGFFDVPVDNLPPINHFIEVIEELKRKYDVVLVDPDSGSAKRNEDLAKITGIPSVIVDKRKEDYKAVAKGVYGLVDEIKGKVAVTADDIIGSGGTLLAAAEIIKTYEPLMIVAIASHLIGNPSKVGDRETGLEKLQRCDIIDQVYVTDSNYSPIWSEYPKIRVMSIRELLADAMVDTQTGGSISRLFPKIPKN